MKKNYTFFDRFVFRTPFYSYDRKSLKTRISDMAFDEAIYLASPDFFKERNRTVASGKHDPKIEQSLYKYLTRATTRCTPFGMFAGCSTGYFGDDDSAITLADQSSNKRIVRLDMNYLCTLVQNLESQPEIREKLKFSPNDSIYYLGGRLRYVEYDYVNKQRVHRISSVDPDDYLKSVLEFAASGKYIHEIVDFLTDEDDEIEEGDAREYTEELVSSQLLKSELELSVTGDDAFEKLIARLNDIDVAADIAGKLAAIKDILAGISTVPSNEALEKYQSLVSIIKETGVAFDPKFLFQCDIYKPSVEGALSQNIKEELSSLIDFLCRITPAPPRTNNLSEFCKTFHEYYEECEMPLLQVLDSELGIGFSHNGSADEPNDLLRGLGGMHRIDSSIQQPARQSILEPVLLKKYIEHIRNGTDRITLEDSDFGKGRPYTDDLPATMYLMCSIVGGKYLVKFCGGSSGANLLGRFCHLDPSIEDFAREITAMDQRLNPDAILAEIVHLPESRTGNILFRPVLRDYEIHYLAKPAVTDDFCIPLSDLMVSVNKGKARLRSKRLNREIIPRLTTAHNFSNNALPVYRFLCELQTQNIRGGLYFSWGSMLSGFDHKPRVEYGNFILSRAQWLIDKETFPKPDEDIEPYLEERHIPRCVVIPDGDNEQYIDFQDEQSVDLFRSMLDKRKSVTVEEFLFDSGESPVKDISGGRYCNEFIFACHKTN